MGGLRGGAWVAALGAFCALLLPVGASASVVRVQAPGQPLHPETSLVFEADPGEANDVVITSLLQLHGAEPLVFVSDRGAAPRTGPGCISLGAKALCIATIIDPERLAAEWLPNIDLLYASLGDGDDRLVSNVTAEMRVNGGEGNDDIAGPMSWQAVLYGGEGDDRLAGGDPGADLLIGGRGADEMLGAGNVDTVSYDVADEPRTSVDVTLDDEADDGEPGEGDNAHSDIEYVWGDRNAPNHLVGSSAANHLYGGHLADDIEGGAGADELYGYDGDDILRSRDGTEDQTVDCAGGSADTVFADPLDSPIDCESIDLGP